MFHSITFLHMHAQAFTAHLLYTAQAGKLNLSLQASAGQNQKGANLSLQSENYNNASQPVVNILVSNMNQGNKEHLAVPRAQSRPIRSGPRPNLRTKYSNCYSLAVHKSYYQMPFLLM
jgi:hypothetical protein